MELALARFNKVLRNAGQTWLIPKTGAGSCELDKLEDWLSFARAQMAKSQIKSLTTRSNPVIMPVDGKWKARAPDPYEIEADAGYSQFVLPLHLFDLTTPEGQRACFHWSNQRPTNRGSRAPKTYKEAELRVHLAYLARYHETQPSRAVFADVARPFMRLLVPEDKVDTELDRYIARASCDPTHFRNEPSYKLRQKQFERMGAAVTAASRDALLNTKSNPETFQMIVDMCLNSADPMTED